jgi:hypothetical protein
MGSLYALIPSLTNFEEDEAPSQHYQFWVMKVNGGEVGRMVVRLSNVEEQMKLRRRIRKMQANEPNFQQLNLVAMIKHMNRYKCSSRGSVIWVALDKYWVSYDVGAGDTQIHIIPTLLNGSYFAWALQPTVFCLFT